MIVLGIDPGSTESGWCAYDTDEKRPLAWGKNDNSRVLNTCAGYAGRREPIIIEQMSGYGMTLGSELIAALEWTGRFVEAAGGTAYRIARRDVKLHLCDTARAGDAQVRDAIIQRYGGKEKAIGRKKTPGPLYGIAGDAWAALALCIVWYEQKEASGDEEQAATATNNQTRRSQGDNRSVRGAAPASRARSWRTPDQA